MKNYEKAYKKALERAKGIINYYKECNRSDETAIEDLEQIFPELQESEDEKIRKWLLDTITQIPNDSIEWDVINKTDVLAWLEKQGEQKPTWSEEDEKIALSIEQVMNCASLLNIMPDKIERVRTWLKTIKQRII